MTVLKIRKNLVIHPCRYCYEVMGFRYEWKNYRLYGMCSHCYKVQQKYFYDKEDVLQVWIPDNYKNIKAKLDRLK